MIYTLSENPYCTAITMLKNGKFLNDAIKIRHADFLKRHFLGFLVVMIKNTVKILGLSNLNHELAVARKEMYNCK
jgi:hypothetical protein